MQPGDGSALGAVSGPGADGRLGSISALGPVGENLGRATFWSAWTAQDGKDAQD